MPASGITCFYRNLWILSEVLLSKQSLELTLKSVVTLCFGRFPGNSSASNYFWEHLWRSTSGNLLLHLSKFVIANKCWVPLTSRAYSENKTFRDNVTLKILVIYKNKREHNHDSRSEDRFNGSNINYKQKQPLKDNLKIWKILKKHVCRSLFFNKISGRSSVTLWKKWLQDRYCSENFAKFLKIPIL